MVGDKTRPKLALLRGVCGGASGCLPNAKFLFLLNFSLDLNPSNRSSPNSNTFCAKQPLTRRHTPEQWALRDCYLGTFACVLFGEAGGDLAL